MADPKQMFLKIPDRICELSLLLEHLWVFSGTVRFCAGRDSIVCAVEGKCGYIHRMAEVNIPLPFVGTLRDDSAVDRMCLYFGGGFWRFSCPRDVDVVGHDGFKLHA